MGNAGISIVLATSLFSGLTAYLLARCERATRISRTCLAGLMSTVLIVVGIIILHFVWLNQQGEPPSEEYSPLIFLIAGIILIVLVANLTVQYGAARAK